MVREGGVKVWWGEGGSEVVACFLLLLVGLLCFVLVGISRYRVVMYVNIFFPNRFC